MGRRRAVIRQSGRSAPELRLVARLPRRQVQGIHHPDGGRRRLEPFPGGEVRDTNLAGFRKIQNTPKWTASGTLRYETPLAEGTLNLLTTLSYRSKSQQFEIASPGLDQKGFSLLDASAVYELPGGHWTVGLHGKNLTDKRYIVAGYNFLNVNPYTGEFINNGATPGAAGGVPGSNPPSARKAC